MQIQYERTAANSYMAVRDADRPHPEYVERMLEKNRIPSLLPVRILEEDGSRVYWYEITGLMSLELMMERSAVSFAEVKNLICGICDLKLSLEKYLLDEGDVCFRPDTVFLEPAGRQLYFCFLPGYGQKEENGIRTLFETVLEHLDHMDMPAVQVAYAVYNKSTAGNIGVEELMRTLREGEPEGKGTEVPSGWKTESPGEVLSVRETDGLAQKELWDDSAPLTLSWDTCGSGEDRKQRRKQQKVEKRQKRQKLQDIQKPQIRQSRQNRSDYEPAAGSFRKKEAGKQDKKEGRRRFSRRRKDGRERTAAPDPFADSLFGSRGDSGQAYTGTGSAAGGYFGYEIHNDETMLLNDSGRDGVLKLVYHGDGKEPDFQIDHFPYLIGKESAGADGCLNADTVSRMHARIGEQNGTYYIEDLNSTNGTLLNGRLLAYHTPQEIRRNDRITFATEEYRVL